ncbi:carboxylesterase [Roseovarius gahaiensis]|uniref:Carboxylesterase n=1 Tax=Roseovarius gahaiensis TaxID=2716691 RepID=A0A967EIK1_9RHOB|nr:holin family protein [Roseovarius gahaiensis]NHQ72992.1 carboxylesterase [Roseovarius gahaiensis]
MGLMERLVTLVFGDGRNMVRDTVEVFRENAESGAARDAAQRAGVVDQFGAEFSQPSRGLFDRIMDGVNRVPRPAMALGTLGLFAAAMIDPVWFAARMQGIALVPEPLWWLLGAIVSFYFGARHQLKGQQFQQSVARTLARTPQVADNLQRLEQLRPDSPGVADPGPDARAALTVIRPAENPALAAWQARDAARAR